MPPARSRPAPPLLHRMTLPGDRMLALLVLVVAALLSAVTALDGTQPNDEGLMLQAAARIADGQLPYADFWWYYPPGQPYLLAGLWEAFGPSLLAWRVVRVAVDAAVALLVYLLARRFAEAPLALAAALAAALAMAYPSGPHPFPAALALALAALLLLERRPAAAGALVGVCAVWRIEFAAYLWLGAMCAYVVRPEPERRGPALRLSLTAAAVALLAYAPLLAGAGLGTSLDLLVRYPLEDFGDYQSLPFPLEYDGPLLAGSLGDVRNTAENLLQFYLPLALIVGLVASLAGLGLRFRRAAWEQLAAALFAVGMAHYLLVRPDLFHTAPLAVMVAVLAAWVLAERALPVPARRGASALGRAAAVLAAAVLAFLLLEGADRRLLALEDHTVPLDLPVADGVRERPARAQAMEAAAGYVRGRVPPGRPIYVATRRSDLVTSGNPLFYVLAGRPNPTRYDIAAPGVVTTAPVQREIVAALERERVGLVVRFTDPVTAAREPNRAGRSTGVRVLDRYLGERFSPVARFGPYLMLER